MKNLILLSPRLAGVAVKCVAVALALNLVLAPLLSAQATRGQTGCTECAQLQEHCAVLEEDCARLREELETEFSMLRRVELQSCRG